MLCIEFVHCILFREYGQGKKKKNLRVQYKHNQVVVIHSWLNQQMVYLTDIKPAILGQLGVEVESLDHTRPAMWFESWTGWPENHARHLCVWVPNTPRGEWRSGRFLFPSLSL